MLFYPDMPLERRRFLHALIFPLGISFILILSFVLQRGMGWDVELMGVLPRTLTGVKGVLLHPFAHADWVHLLNNVITFFILSVALFYFYRQIALRVLLLLWLLTGGLLWFIGRDSVHIGVSGIVYGLAFFVFWGGVLIRNISLLSISLAVVFWYGSMVWDMLPFLPNETISWEGHLSGAIAGSVLAFVFRRTEVFPDNKNDDFTEDDNDELAQIALKYEKEGDLIREGEDIDDDSKCTTK